MSHGHNSFHNTPNYHKHTYKLRNLHFNIHCNLLTALHYYVWQRRMPPNLVWGSCYVGRPVHIRRKKLRFLLVASITDTKFAAPWRIFCTGYLQGHLNTFNIIYDCALCSVKVLFRVLLFKSCQSPVSCVDLRWKPRVCVEFQEKYFCWSAVFISKPHEFGWHKKLKSLVFTSNAQGQLFL